MGCRCATSCQPVCSESVLIFVLCHFCISWVYKLFPQTVEYGPLRCYFYVVGPVRGDVKLLCTSVVQ